MKKASNMVSRRQWSLILLLIVCTTLTGFAGEISQVVYKNKGSISVGTTLSVYDYTVADETAHPTWYSSNYTNARKQQVRLTYNREGRTDVPSLATWSYKIDYEVYPTGAPGSTNTGSVTVTHDPSAANDIYEAINEHALNYTDATLKVTAITTTGATPPNDIRLELITVTERYTDLALSSAPAPLIDYNSTTSELTWGYVPGSEEYDVEFTFIDDKDTPPTFSAFEDVFDYKTPIRVTTSNQFYLVDQVYPKGKLYFRVRGVGRHITGVSGDYTHTSVTDWGYTTTLGGGTQEQFAVGTSFEPSMNWGYTAVYAEDGKSKKGIGYSDGGGKSRQSQATMNSDNTVIVGENRYDREGRAVLSILPTPVEVTDPLTAFRYRGIDLDGVLFNSAPPSGGEYDYQDFELGTNPMGNLSGAGKYYSNQNAFLSTDAFAKYTDDAGGAATGPTHDGGYPFTQILYTRDNTGRISKTTAGAGTTYAMGNGHDLSYYYCTANETELHRMFGTNVGIAKHYKKNLAVDANGQISVSYLDQEERVVATCLAGASPTNVLTLDSNVPETITVSLNGNNTVDPANSVSYSVSNIANVAVGTLHSFTYDMKGVIYGANINIDGMNGCMTDDVKPICASCKYKLKISVTDPDGLVVQIPDPTPVDELTRDFSNPAAPDCGFNQYDVAGVNFDLTFNKIGNYTVSKTLTLDTTGIYLDIQAALAAAGYDDTYLEGLVDCFISQTDFGQCDITCEQHCRTYVLAANPSWDPNDPADTASINSAVRSCISSTCGDLIDDEVHAAADAGCDIMLQQMILDVSPHGFEFNMNNPTSGTDNGFWTRVSTIMGATPSYSGTPPTPTDLADPDQIILLDNTGAWINPQPSVITPGGLKEASYWLGASANPTQWAEQLVKAHRDYCHYENCVLSTSSTVYDNDLAALDTGWYAAKALGYLDPLGIGRTSSAYTYPTGVSSLVTYVSAGVDPLFAVQGNPTKPTDCNDKYNVLYDKLTTEFLCPPCSTGYTDIWHYVADPANTALYTAVSYNSTNMWKIFRGLYLDKKFEADSSIAFDSNCESCKYYSDSQVAPPPASLAATSGTITSSYDILADCTEKSTLNVIWWMDQMEHFVDSSECAGTGVLWSSAISAADEIDIKHNLMQYCQSRCGVLNPMGYVLDTFLHPSIIDSYLGNVNTLLTSAGCAAALDYISAGDPYNTVCPTSGGATVIGTFPNDCFKQLVTYINGTVLPAVSTTCFTYPSGSATDSLFGTGASPCLGSYLKASGTSFSIGVNSGCSLPSNYSIIRFYRTDGTAVDVDDMSSISLPVYHVASPVTGSPSGVFQHMSVIINSTFGTPDEGPIQAYVYQERIGSGSNYSLLEGNTITSTCTARFPDPQAYGITVDYDDLQDDCINNLLSLDTVAAQQQFNLLVAEFTDQYLNAHFNNCFSSNLHEDFYYEYESNEYHYTLYYYDQAGNLTQTVPPQGVHLLAMTAFTLGVYNGTPEPAHTYRTRYTYNSLNQVLSQQTPDGGLTNYYYDDEGRLRFSQNAKQEPSDQYSYTIYDDLSRITEVGQSDQIYGSDPFSDGVNDMSFPNSNRTQVTRTTYDDSPGGGPSAIFAAASQQFTRTRVALTEYFRGAYNGTTAGLSYATWYSYDEHGNVNELVQDNASLSGLGGSREYKYMSYKYQLVSGNVEEMAYQPGKLDQFYHRYIYDDDNRLTIAMTSNNGLTWEKDAKYFYYKHGPLARTETGEDKVQGTDYAYTINGWLKGINATTLNTDRDMGKDGDLLTSTTMDPDNNNNLVAQDVLGYTMGYYDGDYTSIGSSSWEATTASTPLSSGAYKDLFNGNISRTTSAFLDNSETAVPTMGKSYVYDQLNRLKNVHTFTDMTGSTDNILTANSFSGSSDISDYREEFSYDANGNITDVERWGNNAGLTKKMDELHYSYEDYDTDPSYGVGTYTNKLRFVSDNSALTTNYTNLDIDDQSASYGIGSENYTYDAIGNLVGDQTEEIANIAWNVYGKIDSITRTSGSNKSDLRFRYDANGNRICKIVIPHVSGAPVYEEDWIYTYYVRDAQGNVIAVYDRDIHQTLQDLYDQMVLKEHHMYGSSHLGIEDKNLNTGGKVYGVPTGITHATDGSIVRPASPGNITADAIPAVTRTVGDRNYELNNHLGNVMVVVTDKKIGVDADLAGTLKKAEYYIADVISAQDYYSFGALMPGRKFNTNAYRYGFNGKENDNEIYNSEGTFQDYGLRMYDPRLGRFISVDPLTSEFPHWTPYQFAGNMPIKYIDLDGGEPKDPGCDGDVADAPMTAPDACGNYDDNMHTWQWGDNGWDNMGITVDSRTQGVEQPDIISRGEWGADKPNSRSDYTQVDPTEFYKYIAIHHAGNDNSPTIQQEQNAHQVGNGWNDLGYHFAIDLKGNIYAGRPLWKQGAACEPAADKQGVLSICILGDMQSNGWSDWSNDQLTPEATKSLIKLCTYLSVKYNIQYIGGHQDVFCNHTECPGNQVMDILPDVRSATGTMEPPCLSTDKRSAVKKFFGMH
jgi:RHS repeat-associated protein